MLIVRNSLLTLIRKCLHLSSKRSVQPTLVTCFIISVGFSLCLRWLNIFYLQKPLDLTLSYIVFMFFLSSRTIIFINIRRYLIKIQASTWLCLVFVLLTFKIFLLTLVHAVWFFFLMYLYYLHVCLLIWLVKLKHSFGWVTEMFLTYSELNISFNFFILIITSSKICVSGFHWNYFTAL